MMMPASSSTSNRGWTSHIYRVWIGICRETVKVKSARGVLDSSIERFKLVALERPGLVSIFKLNDDASVLHVNNMKSPMRERRNERRTLGEVVEAPREACASWR